MQYPLLCLTSKKTYRIVACTADTAAAAGSDSTAGTAVAAGADGTAC